MTSSFDFLRTPVTQARVWGAEALFNFDAFGLLGNNRAVQNASSYKDANSYYNSVERSLLEKIIVLEAATSEPPTVEASEVVIDLRDHSAVTHALGHTGLTLAKQHHPSNQK